MVVTALVACSARKSEVHWYKGNLHAHTIWSDGDALPEALVQWYSDHGYQFLGLAEHNAIADREAWVSVDEAKRRATPGVPPCWDIGVCRPVSRIVGGVEYWRLTPFTELQQRFERPREFMLLQNEEVTNDLGAKRVHLTAVNLVERIAPMESGDVASIVEQTLSRVREQAASKKRPTLGIVNHPNFTWSVNAEILASVRAAQFVEVFNGHPYSASRGDAGRRSVVRMWDMANAERILGHGWSPLYGVAADDTHALAGASQASPGRGWIVVRASHLDAAEIVESMLRGDFYASTGVVLNRCDYDRRLRRLSIDVVPVPGIVHQIDFIATKRHARPRADVPPQDRWDAQGVGGLVKRVMAERGEYELATDDVFVRATITAPRRIANPAQSNYTGDDVQFEEAFTQPVGWE
jgi:hypothetical protein